MSNDSIFLAPKDGDSDDAALPKLRAYYASQRNQHPECEAREYWDKFINMTDDDLLAHWRDGIRHRTAIMAAYRAAGH